MSNAKFVTFKKWSGWKIRGTEKVAVPLNGASHAERLFYLTAQLEAPSWGGVQSYDGVGMSAGPIHNIAVHRNGTQGSLIKLLRHLEANARSPKLEKLFHRLDQCGWYIAHDGRLRSNENGRKIPGKDIVTEFTGPRGVSLRRGGDSKAWAILFHEAFSDPATYAAQMQFALDWILNSQEALESQAYQLGTGEWNFDSDDAAAQPMAHLGAGLDLAMCVYHSHSVNAPGKAKQVLKRLLGTKVTKEDFPRRLIRTLALTKYGRWHDTPDNRNRYDRTRIAVRRSKLWPAKVVNRLMPKNF